MDINIHSVKGVRIERYCENSLNTIDIVIEHESLADSRSVYNRDGADETSLGYAKLETKITLFVKSSPELDLILWKTVSEVTSQLANA